MLAADGLWLVRRDEYVLDFGERVQRVRAEFAAQPRLLEPAERGPGPDGGVRVDRQAPGLHRPRAPRAARGRCSWSRWTRTARRGCRSRPRWPPPRPRPGRRPRPARTPP